MTPSPPTELGQAEIKRGAAVLFYLLIWQDGFGNDGAVRSLREARLDVAIEVTPSGHPRVHPAVLKAFHALAGRAAFWDSAWEVWRERREDDPE